MAKARKSAGDVSVSHNTDETGTASLDQARDACSDEAFFIGASAEALDVEISGLLDLGPQLDMVLELINTGRGDAGGPADSLVCVARARLDGIVENLEKIQIEFERRAHRMGTAMTDASNLPSGWRAEYALAGAQDIGALALAALTADSSNQVLMQAAMVRIAQLAATCMSALDDEVETREVLHKRLFGVSLQGETSEARHA